MLCLPPVIRPKDVGRRRPTTAEEAARAARVVVVIVILVSSVLVVVVVVGIIPGPHKLAFGLYINFLQPIVNDFLVLWQIGIWISALDCNKEDCLLCVVILSIVLDFPTMQKAAGHAGIQAHTTCLLCCLKKAEMNNLDLSYRNLTKQIVIASMHNLVLRIIKVITCQGNTRLTGLLLNERE